METQVTSELTSHESVIDAKPEPDWLRELHAVLVVYWETGEVSDDIDDEWFDEMIERVTPLALEEKRLEYQRNKQIAL